MPRYSALEGAAELEESLAALPVNIAKGAARRVLRRAGELIAAVWRANVRDDPATPNAKDHGDYKTNIAVSSRLERGLAGKRAKFTKRMREGADEATAFVGPTKKAYPQAMTEEFGTPDQAPNAPGRRAWEQTQEQVLDVIAAELRPEIEKTAARLAKRIAKQGK